MTKGYLFNLLLLHPDNRYILLPVVTKKDGDLDVAERYSPGVNLTLV